MHGTGATATRGVVLRRLVWALAEIGALESAAVIAGAESRGSLNLPMRVRERHRHETVLRALTEQLGAATFERLLARGAALRDDELVATLAEVQAAIDDRDTDDRVP